MNLSELRDAVAANPDCGFRIELANGAAIDPHFHVTEIGRVAKDFVDCGGVRRSEVRCLLQTLVASDTDHRLTTTKLDKILALADRLDLPDEATVEVEHQERSVSTDLADTIVRQDDTLVLRLSAKQTACLAEDFCGIPAAPSGGSALPIAGQGCSGTGCC